MGSRRNRLRKQVTEGEERPSELKRKREARKRCAWQVGVWRGAGVLPRESCIVFF